MYVSVAKRKHYVVSVTQQAAAPDICRLSMALASKNLQASTASERVCVRLTDHRAQSLGRGELGCERHAQGST